MHVPKTGGITLTSELGKMGGKAPYVFYLRESNKENESGRWLTGGSSWYPGKCDLGRYDLLLGHGFLDSFQAAGADTFITVLREPRSRLLSSYFYFRDFVVPRLRLLPPSMFDVKLFAPRRLSLMEYILAADRDANPICNLCAPDDKGIASTIAALRNFAMVGFTEKLGDAVNWLSGFFSTRLFANNTVNATCPRGETILGGSVDEIVDALDRRTAPDGEIYRWAAGNRREGFSAPPDPDETLERAMAKFGIV